MDECQCEDMRLQVFISLSSHQNFTLEPIEFFGENIVCHWEQFPDVTVEEIEVQKDKVIGLKSYR